MNFDDESNNTTFDALQIKLKQIRTGIPADTPDKPQIANIIEQALSAPLLSIGEEADLYEAIINSTGDTADKARTRLVDAHYPMVVVKAWEEYRFFEIPFEKLVEAGRRALEQGTFTFKYPTSPLKTFHSHVSETISESMLKVLDECGLELVNLEEIRELTEEGRTIELEKILAPLSQVEKEWIKRRCTASTTSMFPATDMPEFVERLESVVLRKLRRAKKS